MFIMSLYIYLAINLQLLLDYSFYSLLTQNSRIAKLDNWVEFMEVILQMVNILFKNNDTSYT